MGISLDPQTAATALGVILLAVGALMSAPSLVTSVGTWLQEEDVIDMDVETLNPDVLKKVHDSDKPPPDGFKEYIDVIYRAADGAPSDVIQAYLVAGYTEADVLRCETKRLKASA